MSSLLPSSVERWVSISPLCKSLGDCKTQNNFLLVHGQVAAGCCFACVLDMVRSSPSSCFIKWRQTATVSTGTETPTVLAQIFTNTEHSRCNTFWQMTPRCNTFWQITHAANCSYSLIGISAGKASQEVSLNLFPYIRPIYTTDSRGRLSFPFELLGRLANKMGWVFRKMVKTHKPSWILHLKEKKTVRFLGKTG